MWPWEHLAFGYLLYSLALRAVGRRPDGPAALALALGTQFPDLVDKPGAWYLGVLPSGRSLAHSAFVAAVLVTVVFVAARARGRSGVGWGFGTGYATHLLGDALDPLVSGHYGGLAFLLYPLRPAVVYPDDGFGFQAAELAAMVAGLEPSPAVFAYLLVFVATFGLWVLDGTPGLGPVRGAVARR